MKFLKQEINKHTLLFFLIIIFINCYAYFSSLKYPLDKLDETTILILHNSSILHDCNISDLLTRDAFFSKTKDIGFYRPVQNLSFCIDTALFGSIPLGYRLINLLFHIITCLFVLFLISQFFIDKLIALLITLLYSINPVLVHAVAWIPARGDILMTMFCLISLIAMIKYFKTNKFLYLFITYISLMLALFSKETAIIFPSVIFLFYKMKILNINNNSGVKKYFTGVIFLIILYVLIRFVIIKINTQTIDLIVALKNICVLPELIAKFIFPICLSPLPLFSFFKIILGLFIFGIILFKFYKNNFIIFGFLWFVIMLLPTLIYKHELYPHVYDYLEHRAYLPFIGLLFLFEPLNNIKKQNINKGWGLFSFVILIFLILTVNRLKTFKSFETYYQASVTEQPCFLSYYNLSIAYIGIMDYNKSIVNVQEAIKFFPEYPDAYTTLGNCYLFLHQDKEAAFQFKKTIKINKSAYITYMNLSQALMNLNQLDEATLNINKAFEISKKTKNVPQAFNTRALINARKQNYNIAIDDFQRAIQLNPNYIEAHMNIGNCYFYLNNKKDACKNWSKAKELGNKEALSLINKYCF